MDKLQTIIAKLCVSNFLPEWILELRNNEVLFSARKNIKPCIQEGDYVRSSVWAGLMLLRSYCKRGFSNPDVDEFIVSLLQEAISIYRADKETDPYKKLSSSQVILDGLLDIILSKKEFFDGVDFASFVRIYMDSATARPYSLAYDLYRAKGVLVAADQKKVFNVYKAILEHGFKNPDYADYLVIEDLIRKNPSDYYEYSKAYLLDRCTSVHYFDMGAFFEYQKSHSHRDDIPYFRWLRIASKYIEEPRLKSDIKSFIGSDVRLLNKVGLCLINLNFERTRDLFFGNLDLFFSKKDFYADLRCLFETNPKKIFSSGHEDSLTQSLTKATFGLNDGRIGALKNYIARIYSANGLLIPFYKPAPEEIEYVVNYDKAVYSVNVNTPKEAEIIKSSLKGKTIEEAQTLYSQLISKSRFYKETVQDALCEYLLEEHPNDFVDHIEGFGNEFSAHFLYHLATKNHTPKQATLQAVQKTVELIGKDSSFLSCISAMLFAIGKLEDSLDPQSLKDLVLSIDYKWIAVSDYESRDNIVLTCINEDLHSYFELVTHACDGSNDIAPLKEAIEYHKAHNDCAKFRSIVASIYPKLFSFDEDYASSLADYVFTNNFEGRNLSYPLLAMSNQIDDRLLDFVGERSDIATFLLEGTGSDEEEMGLENLSLCFFRRYIYAGKFENIVRLQFQTRKFDVILECIRTMNYWLASGPMNSDTFERYKAYLAMFVSLASKEGIFYSEFDYLIDEVAATILATNDFDPITWDLFLLLFRHFDRYFSDECVRLIKEYKDKRPKEIAQILESYFLSYVQHESYDETVVEVYNLIAMDKNYRGKAKKWKVALVNKNTELRAKLN